MDIKCYRVGKSSWPSAYELLSLTVLQPQNLPGILSSLLLGRKGLPKRPSSKTQHILTQEKKKKNQTQKSIETAESWRLKNLLLIWLL